MTNLNSFIVPDDIVRKMKDKIRESQFKMVETGFSLCKEKDGNILKLGNECEGTKCRIERPIERCRGKEDEYKGLYHTHPSGDINPSIDDLYGMYKDGLGCIGSPNKIRCFIRKDPKIDINTLVKLQRAYLPLATVYHQLPKEDFEKLYDAIIKYLTNENFKVVNME